MDILTRLKALAEPEYRAFQCKLMPTVDPARVLGVRTPLVRSLARELTGTLDAESFLRTLPHPTYEENNLHAFLIERERDFDRALALLDAFLPYVDNWATCDSMSPKVFGKHLPELWAHIPLWLGRGDTYTVRFGIGMLMSWYPRRRLYPRSPRTGSGGAVRGVLCQHDGCMVLCDRSCQAVRCSDSISHRTPPAGLDAQQNHPQGHRKQPDFQRYQEISAYITDQMKRRKYVEPADAAYRRIFRLSQPLRTLRVCSRRGDGRAGPGAHIAGHTAKTMREALL